MIGAGDLELVPEAVDRLLVGGDLGFEELEGDLLVEFRVEDLVDPAHAAVPQLFDDLVAAGERRTRLQLFDGRLNGLRLKNRDFFSRGERGGALPAIIRIRGIFEMAPGALHNPFSLLNRWAKA